MTKFIHSSLSQFLEQLAAKTPVPGGGSAAALTASTATALISMVAQYSLGKGLPAGDEKRLRDILKRSEAFRLKFMALVDQDAEAYLAVVAARSGTARQKEAARKGAAKVPFEMAKLCLAAIDLTPFLVQKGNRYLLSDVEVAVELLQAAFQSALINVRVNS